MTRQRRSKKRDNPVRVVRVAPQPVQLDRSDLIRREMVNRVPQKWNR